MDIQLPADDVVRRYGYVVLERDILQEHVSVLEREIGPLRQRVAELEAAAQVRPEATVAEGG